jgi:multiple sugar transport system substrate-binding protein
MDQHPFPRDDPDAFSDITLGFVDDGGLGPLTDLYGYLVEEEVGADFEVTTHPYQQLYEKLTSEFLTGDPPGDLVSYPPIFLGDMNSRGVFASLDGYLEEYEGTDEFVSDVFDPFWDFYCTYNGSVKGIPIDGDILVVTYRPSFFEDEQLQEQYQDEYGEELTPPDTWPEYNQQAKFFTENTDKFGTVLHGQRPWCWSMWMNRAASNGAVYFDENMEPMVDSPEAVEALEHMVETLDYCPEGTAQFDSPEVLNTWADGKTVMGEWWVTITQVAPDAPVFGDQGVIQMPGWEQEDGSIKRTSVQAYARILGIPENISEERQRAAFYAALRLARNPVGRHHTTNAHMGTEGYAESMYNDEAVQLLLEEDDLMNPDAEVDGDRIDRGNSQVYDSEDMARQYIDGNRANHQVGFPQPQWPGARQYNTAMGVHVQEALTGQKSPEQALSDLADRMATIRDDLGREEQQEFWNGFVEKAKRYDYM